MCRCILSDNCFVFFFLRYRSKNKKKCGRDREGRKKCNRYMKICFFCSFQMYIVALFRVYMSNNSCTVYNWRAIRIRIKCYLIRKKRGKGGRVRGPFFDIRISANCRISVFGNVVNSTEVKNPTGPTMKFGNFILWPMKSVTSPLPIIIEQCFRRSVVNLRSSCCAIQPE